MENTTIKQPVASITSGKQIIPIGLNANGERQESDSMGSIGVPADHYWDAQTQRSLVHFSIGNDRMPKEVYHAYGYVKKAAALVNEAEGRLDKKLAEAIVAAADEVIFRKAGCGISTVCLADGSGTTII